MAKARQLENLFFKNADGEIKDLKIGTVINTISKEVGIKKKEGEDVMALVLAGKELDLDDSDMDAASKKLLQKAHRILSKVLVNHDKYAVTEQKKADAEKAEGAKEEAEAEKLKAAQDKKNNAIALASSKAHALSAALTDQAVASLQKVLGKNFVVTNTGLTIADGSTITEENMATLIATLTTSSEGLDDIRAITMWNLGDAVVALEDNFPERAEMIVLAAVNPDGKGKHTIQCAVATCRKTPHDRRFPELSFTHHQEIANYAHLIKSKKTLDKIINDARFHHKTEVKLADGTVVEQWRPMSCAQLRAALKEAAGLTAKKEEKEATETEATEAEEVETAKDAPAATRGYIYTETATGDAFASGVLSMKALQSGQFSVLDLDAMRQLLSDGSEGDQIMQLPAEWFDTPEPAPDKVKKAAKPKKEKPAVADSEPEKPKADDSDIPG